MRKCLLALLLVSLAGVGTATRASAETYPTRPLTMIVPFPAGGITDITARIVAEGMLQRLGQTVIVENMPGAASRPRT